MNFLRVPKPTWGKLKVLARRILLIGGPPGLMYYYEPAARYELRKDGPEFEEYAESVGELRPLKYKNRYTPEEAWERLWQAQRNSTNK